MSCQTPATLFHPGLEPAHPVSGTVAQSHENEDMLRIASGVVLLLVGAIWMLQGLEVAFAPESFMTGDRTWVGVGVIAVVSGVGLAWWGVRSERRRK
jgi:hypothetical protein